MGEPCVIRIGYLAHDLGDAAVHRRVAMLRAGGADVALAGLVRGAGKVPDTGVDRPLVLGRSEDARLARRVPQIARISLFGIRRMMRHFGRVDAVVARNLEMLAVAERLVRQMRPRPRLVYECLDIHRLLTSPGLAGRVLREIEQRLAPSVDLVVTSSPAFVENHLGQRALYRATLLAENKVLNLNEKQAATAPTPSGSPWRIGWFGALRCRRSFEMLAALAERSAGRVEVVIRGRPSPAIFPDLPREAENRPHLRFEGPYRNPEDLARIYGEIHFSWCIDFYEEGANSAWLLPNRLYEGGFHGTVPIALERVETGRFLSRHGFGIRLGDSPMDDLTALFRDMTQERYACEVEKVRRQPAHLWEADRQECVALVEAIAGMAGGPDLQAAR